MFRRDLLLAEIQKLSLALSRLIGLKEEDKGLQLEKEMDELLEKDFGILYTDLLQSGDADFTEFLKEKNFTPEKLDMLSQLLFLRIDPDVKDKPGQKELAGKLLLIYGYLEQNHQIINMLNIGRQQTLKTYL